jgi:hypothetical protein
MRGVNEDNRRVNEDNRRANEGNGGWKEYLRETNEKLCCAKE